MRLIGIVFVIAVAAGSGAHCVAQGADVAVTGTLPLKHVEDLPLPGRASRFDYESYDPVRHLLFIAHLGDSEVVVFDTVASRVVARIPGISAVHGVLAVPDLSRVYASATGTNEIVAIDERTLKVVATAPGGVYPDGMAYAPDARRLYVSDATGETETVIDVTGNRLVVTIPLDGEVGYSQYDPVSRHIFVNVQTRRQLVEIDPPTNAIVFRTDLPGAKGNHGLLIVPESRLALIACEDNARLQVLDMRSMRARVCTTSVLFRRLRRFTSQLCLSSGLLLEDLMAAVVGHLFPVLRFFPRSIKAYAESGFAIERAHIDARRSDCHRSDGATRRIHFDRHM
jgi:DNA-binding beta-propeller fold protein YncE